MTSPRSLTSAATTNAVFNFVAAAGLILQIVIGVPGFPPVPPGPFILGIAGILVLALFARLPWIAAVGVAAPAFILAGGVIEGSIFGRLANPADFGPFLGTALQEIGCIVAIVYGVVALVQAYRKAPVR